MNYGMFYIFFAAILAVVVQIISEDTGLAAELVHIKNLPTTKKGPWSRLWTAYVAPCGECCTRMTPL